MKNTKPIKGIHCDVCSCQYHDGEESCTAPGIQVGPHDAETCTDTVCATFKPKAE